MGYEMWGAGYEMLTDDCKGVRISGCELLTVYFNLSARSSLVPFEKRRRCVARKSPFFQRGVPDKGGGRVKRI